MARSKCRSNVLANGDCLALGTKLQEEMVADQMSNQRQRVLQEYLLVMDPGPCNEEIYILFISPQLSGLEIYRSFQHVWESAWMVSSHGIRQKAVFPMCARCLSSRMETLAQFGLSTARSGLQESSWEISVVGRKRRSRECAMGDGFGLIFC